MYFLLYLFISNRIFTFQTTNLWQVTLGGGVVLFLVSTAVKLSSGTYPTPTFYTVLFSYTSESLKILLLTLSFVFLPKVRESKSLNLGRKFKTFIWESKS